jgi:DNA polymerase I-like protein with 3'-5' exonuclease and polymerase domains
MFNAKFDIAWLRKAGIDFKGKRLWDVQLAHFYLTFQKARFPSLNEVLEYYGLPPKLDVVETQYWDKGIQTDEIPWEVLCEYGEADVAKTYQCFLRQCEDFKKYPKLYTLFKLGCQDLWVLQEMEWNGLKYDKEKCVEKSKELQVSIQQLASKLATVYPSIPINFNSPNQLSAFLYGGTINEEAKVIDGFYGPKAAKAGQPKYKTVNIEHVLPQIFAPGAKTDSGGYSTDEATLKKLKKTAKNKWIIETLLQLAKLEKLNGTYYEGIDKINGSMCWPESYLHGQYNQCIAQTGRLSSSKPNLQNLSGDALEIFTTRYSS